MNTGRRFTVLLLVLGCAHAQRPLGLPLTRDSLRMIFRFKTPVPQGRVMRADDIRIHFYTTSADSPKSYLSKDAARSILADPDFDRNKTTVFYAHGYLELFTDESVSRVAAAYVSRGVTLLALDYSNLAYGDYLTACTHVNEIAREATSFMSALLLGGLARAALRLVGHSMGAHVMGHVARRLGRRGFRVTRLSGIDPAYPLFYPPFVLNSPLSTSDADFVDIIHTDGGSYGVPASVGHADFWPNGGTSRQPGCAGGTILFTNEDFCSHWRSWWLWSEAVVGGRFLARRCPDYDTFLRGGCRHNDAVHMGHDANTTLRGNFYLRTAAASPFALGEIGAM